MATDIIQVDYRALEKIATLFANEQKRIQSLLQNLHQHNDKLRRGGWIAEASDVFYRDMDNRVFPSLDKLLYALGQSEIAMREIARLMHLAEDDACGGLRGSGAGVNGWQISKDALSLIFGGVGFLEDFLKSNSKTLNGIFKAMPYVEFLAVGAIDWLSGEENFFNAFGRSGSSVLIDLGLDAATGGVSSLVTFVTDVTSLTGQGSVWLERQVNDFLALDPRVRAELNIGLDHADRVYKGIRLSDTIDGIKNTIWDVVGRPAANDIQSSLEHFVKGVTTGEPQEFFQAAQYMAEATLLGPLSPLGTVGTAYNFLTDPDAQRHFEQDTSQILHSGKEFVLSVPQFTDERFRSVLRPMVGGFNSLVNTLPLDPALKQNLNEVSLEAAQIVNTLPIGSFLVGGPIGSMLSVGAQSLQQ